MSLKDIYNKVMSSIKSESEEEKVASEVYEDAISTGESLALTLAKIAMDESLEFKIASESYVVTIPDYVAYAQENFDEKTAEALLSEAEEALASLGDEKLASEVEGFIVHPEYGIVGVV